MAEFHEAQQRDLILFVGGPRSSALAVIESYEAAYKKKVKALHLANIDAPDYLKQSKTASKRQLIEIPVSFKKLDATTISKLLAPYQERLLAATCTKENNIRTYKKVIPHVPYLFTATQDSLDWATDKIEMRKRIREQVPEISPKFLVVNDTREATIKRVEKQIGFPLVVKPAGLASSKLVTICYYREEFEKSLKTVFSSLNRLYKERKREDTPKVLVEEFMDGTMYSIDAYVNSRGFVYHCPPVHIKTGMTVGFDDFFGYQRMAPVQLKEHKIERANQAVTQAIHALGLRNITCHVELMKTEDGWKIIEIGPRVGGYRHEMYKLAYGFNHLLNDTLIRIPQKPVLKNRARQTVAVLQLFAHQEGILHSIDGVKGIPKLESYQSMEVKRKKGEPCRFAKFGGSSVVDVTLAHKSRSQVLADVRRIEKNVRIKVVRNVKAKQ